MDAFVNRPRVHHHRRSSSRARVVLARIVSLALLGLFPGPFANLSAQPAGTAHQHGAHVHGQASVDLQIDARGFIAEFTFPLEVLVGFERAPRNADEQAQLDRALAVLSDPSRVLRPSAAAACSASVPTLQTPDWSAIAAGSLAHPDLLARYRFDCQDRGRLLGVEVIAFDAFSRLRAIEWRSVDERGARAQRLGRSTRIAKLSR